MGAKKEALILKALEERATSPAAGCWPRPTTRRRAGRLTCASTRPDAEISPVGSLRRGCETCGDLDILAAGAPPSLMEAFTGYKLVERVLARGETKSSVLLWGGFQADLRLVPRESLGAALQYFTGSKAHNIALRDRAIQRGFKLNEYGSVPDRRRHVGRRRTRGRDLRGARPRLDSAGAAREPRRDRRRRARIAAALCRSSRPPRRSAHAHHATDGRADAETMAPRRARRRAALHRDHRSQPVARDGQRPRRARALEHATRVRALNARLDGITVLAGIECDIRPDGSMDLADDCLAELDIVIASMHSAFNQDERR